MRDPKRKKRLDLRRKIFSAQNPSSYAFFDKLFGYDKPRWTVALKDRSEWDDYYSRHAEWVTLICGFDTPTCGNAPAWYRRDLNRQLRRKQKRALERSVREWDFDSYPIPNHRRNANWLWW